MIEGSHWQREWQQAGAEQHNVHVSLLVCSGREIQAKWISIKLKYCCNWALWIQSLRESHFSSPKCCFTVMCSVSDQYLCWYLLDWQNKMLTAVWQRGDIKSFKDGLHIGCNSGGSHTQGYDLKSFYIKRTDYQIMKIQSTPMLMEFLCLK